MRMSNKFCLWNDKSVGSIFFFGVLINTLSVCMAAEIGFDKSHFFLDLTTIEWDFVITENEETARYQDIIQRRNPEKTRVSKRWDSLGHSEMIKKTVWIKTDISIPAEFEGYKIGFFCTAIDDDAVFYLNGTKLDSVSYHWGAIVKDPTQIDLTPAVKCGPLPQRVQQYKLMEIPLKVTATFTNPFDPEQINVQAVIQTPSGEIEKVPAFFNQDFEAIQVADEQGILLPIASYPWKLYYRPRQVGKHEMELFAQDQSGIKKWDAGSFRVTESDHKGYLRISQKDPRFFEFENGDSFYGTGPSGWYRGSHFIFGGNSRWLPVKMMGDYYERKAEAGSTYEYLATFHFGLLFIKGGFMDLHTTWKLEHVLRTMERLGIYWDVFHDDILRQSRYGFKNMPYSVEQGGPCRDLYEVYYNEEALRMQKNQLRYLVSRMSDSPAIWIWNCGDERGGRPGRRDFSEPLIFSWFKELHGYIRQIDIYQHPHAIGESSSILNGGDVLHIEDWYDRGQDDEDLVQKNIDLYNQFLNANYPVIKVEGGLFRWNQSVYLSGKPYNYPEALSFHNHLWLSLFMKSAAGGTEWLNIVLDYDNEMYYAGVLNKFLQNESLTHDVWEMKYPEIFNKNLRGFVLQSRAKSLVWIHNKESIWWTRARGRTPQAVSNAVIRIPLS